MAQRIVPMLAYEDAAAAIPWLENAFGFRHRCAAEAGAEIIRALEHAREADMRLYTAEDLEGHRWMFGERP